MKTSTMIEVPEVNHRDVYMDAEGLAELLHVHAATIRRAARLGRLPHIRVGRAYRFSMNRIEQELMRG